MTARHGPPGCERRVRNRVPHGAFGSARRWGRRPKERGSVLVLMPAGVLIVLVLASIAVDLAIVQLRQRQAFDLAASAANDAATAGVDPDALRSGVFRLDPSRAKAVVERTLAASELAPDIAATPTVSVSPEAVEVMLTLTADYVFATTFPGIPDGTTVTATATATAIAP